MPRIAVLMHEKHTPSHLRGYLVSLLAQVWEEDGHTVVYGFGTRAPPPADVALLHVDLSVVPDEYLALAAHYPVLLNGRGRDVRKTTYSRGLLRRDSRYGGQVIVKSDLNHAGLPELRLQGRPQTFRTPLDYVVYDDLSLVPPETFDDPSLIVQRFTPEMVGRKYAVRLYSFLGDKSSAVRLTGRHPIVNGPTVEGVETVEPHPDIVAQRHALGLDYGKLDYVEVDGEAILLDANKTVGASPSMTSSATMIAARRERARGIYAFFR